MNSSTDQAEAASLPSPTPDSSKDQRSLWGAAAIFAIGTLSSRVLGLLRDMMTARYFPNDVRDAFFNAFRLPNFFRRLLGEGAFSISFIPVFIEILTTRPGTSEEERTEAERRARGLVGSVFSILASFTMTISILATIFMEDILRVLLSGDAYMSVPGKFEMTVRLGRIMFGFLVLISFYAFFMAVLNSLRKFALTAIAPCFFNLSMIMAAALSPRLAAPENALAWAVILGGVLQMGVLIPAVWSAGYLPVPTLTYFRSLNWGSRDTLRVVKAVLPGMFGMSIFQLTALVNMHFASQLPSGSQSYLYLADRILELPLSLFVVSVGSALLPTLATYHAEGNRQAMSETINRSMRLILFVAWPAALGMFFLAHPIVEVLFLGREFKYTDAVATAQIIQVYSAGLIVVAGVRILAQGFYAIQNAWYPAVAGGVSLLCHVIFATVLTRNFALAGLAAASVASATVNLLMLTVAYRSWVGSLELRKMALSFVKFAVCGAAMVLSLQIYGVIMKHLVSRFFTRSAVLFLTIVVGATVYLLLSYVLRVPECRDSLALFSTKIKRRMGRFWPS